MTALLRKVTLRSKPSHTPGNTTLTSPLQQRLRLRFLRPRQRPCPQSRRLHRWRFNRRLLKPFHKRLRPSRCPLKPCHNR